MFHINFQGCATLKTNMDPPQKTWFPIYEWNILFQGSIWRYHVVFFRVYSCNVWMLVRMIDDPTISGRWNGRHATSFFGMVAICVNLCMVVKKGYIYFLNKIRLIHCGMALWIGPGPQLIEHPPGIRYSIVYWTRKADGPQAKSLWVFFSSDCKIDSFEKVGSEELPA